MISRKFSIIIVTLAILTVSCQNHKTSELVTKKESIFTFKLPNTWRKITGLKLDNLRKQVQEQNYAQARSLGYTNPDDFKIQHFAVFSATKEEIAAVIILVLQIPSTLNNSYLDIMYEDTKEQIYERFGKVFIHEKTEINKVPVLVADVESNEGVRILTYNFWSPSNPNQAAGLQILIAPGYYSEYKVVIDSLLSSLQFSF